MNPNRPICWFGPSYRIEECLNAMREVLESGWVASGEKVAKFEAAWRGYTSLPYAHFVSSHGIGLELALRVLRQMGNWENGDEVITSPIAFVSAVQSIVNERLNPVFCDVDDTLCLDPSLLERWITRRTKAVLYTGVGGNTGHLDQIQAICEKYRLKLILNAAHMVGTKWNAKHVGHGIDCSVFSFHSLYNLPTINSGMVCFRQKEWDLKARGLSWYGIDRNLFERTTAYGDYQWKFEVNGIGLDAQGSALAAALGLVQLKYLEEDNARRRAVAERYAKGLKDISRVQWIQAPKECRSSASLFQVRVPAEIRDAVIASLNRKNIFPGVHYLSNTRYPVLSFVNGNCPTAEKIDSQLISLPVHLKITDEEVDYVIQSFIAALHEGLTDKIAA